MIKVYHSSEFDYDSCVGEGDIVFDKGNYVAVITGEDHDEALDQFCRLVGFGKAFEQKVK